MIFDNDRAASLILRYQSLLANPDGDEQQEHLNLTLDSLLTLCRPLVTAIASAHATDYELDDTVQEIFIHLVSALPTYDPKLATSTKAWLSTVARNRAISLFRQRRHANERETLEFIDDLIGDTTPEQEDIPALLESWLIIRFPSVDSNDLRLIAQIIVRCLSENRNLKDTLERLRYPDTDEPICKRNVLIAVYSSAIWFLRVVGFRAAAIRFPGFDNMEFSLLPELAMLVGPEQARNLYSIFSGMYLHFRVKR